MSDTVTVAISVLALAVSVTTAWLSFFRRGTVKMTQPTVIFFGPDDSHQAPKIYLRTLLFSTSKRGRIIESMHVSLSRNETRQTFNIWVHGDDKLVRGSGLFVGEGGVSANHHFLTPKDDSGFQFTSGRYRLNVYARLLGDSDPIQLFSQELEIAPDLGMKLQQPDAGLYFDWGPDSSRYLPHVDTRPPSSDPSSFLEALRKSFDLNSPPAKQLKSSEQLEPPA